MPMILDNLKFRRLQNGWTVKYHLADGAPDTQRFGGEIFVKDRDELEETVVRLLHEHIPER